MWLQSADFRDPAAQKQLAHVQGAAPYQGADNDIAGVVRRWTDN
jgi:hypothetical protein